MFLVQTTSSGVGFYNMSVYMPELARLLDRSLADVSFAVSLFFLCGGVAGVWIARWLDRVSIKALMAGSALVCAVLLALVSEITQLWQAYVLFAGFGAANTGISLVVATTLITRWFPGPEKSVALSIASTGLSVGGILIAPLSAYLFNSLGFAPTMLVVAAIMALGVVPVVWWLVSWPSASGELDNAGTVASAQDHTAAYKEALRERFFILLSLAYIFLMGSQVGGISHLYNLTETLGGYENAARAVQIMTVTSILGHFSGGWILTRVDVQPFAYANICIQIAGLCVLAAANAQASLILAWSGAALFGVSVGNLLMLQPLWLAQVYHPSIYPRVYAMAYGLSVIGVASGPFLMGVAYDQANYAVAYVCAAAISLLGLVAVLFAGPGRRLPLPA